MRELPGGGRLAVRAEVGRVPRAAREHDRRAPPLVAERASAACATSPSCGRSASCCRRSSALDGEIVISRDGVLDFDAMQTRLHPAESRVNKLSAEIPAEFIAFDVLVWKGEEIWRKPLSERRKELERKAKRVPALPGDARPRRGARLARPLRGDRARRRGRQARRRRRTCRARATASSR